MIITEKQKEQVEKVLALLEGQNYEDVSDILMYAGQEARKRSKLLPKEKED